MLVVGFGAIGFSFRPLGRKRRTRRSEHRPIHLGVLEVRLGEPAVARQPAVARKLQRPSTFSLRLHGVIDTADVVKVCDDELSELGVDVADGKKVEGHSESLRDAMAGVVVAGCCVGVLLLSLL